jgi:BON domain
VSRANLLQAVASLARQVPDPTADDDHIRNRVIDTLAKNDWCPFGLSVVVRDGIVHLSGVITEERSRQAAIVGAENVTGVKKVHDHLCWVDTMSGMYLNSPEDDDLAKAGSSAGTIVGASPVAAADILSALLVPISPRSRSSPPPPQSNLPSGPKNGCGPSKSPIGT